MGYGESVPPTTNSVSNGAVLGHRVGEGEQGTICVCGKRPAPIQSGGRYGSPGVVEIMNVHWALQGRVG